MPQSNLPLHSFPRSERLLKRRDFLGVSAAGKKFYTSHFVVLCRSNGADHPRLGITVSRKVGIAVTRNRVKRLIREFYRQNKQLFMFADYSIIARQGAGILDSDLLDQELQRAITALKSS